MRTSLLWLVGFALVGLGVETYLLRPAPAPVAIASCSSTSFRGHRGRTLARYDVRVENRARRGVSAIEVAFAPDDRLGRALDRSPQLVVYPIFVRPGVRARLSSLVASDAPEASHAAVGYACTARSVLFENGERWTAAIAARPL